MLKFRNICVILNVLLLFLLNGCHILDSSEDSVDARIVLDHLVIENNTDEPVYYFAVGGLTAQLIDWFPRVSDENKIKPGDKMWLSFDQLYVVDDDEEIFIYWWNAKRVDGELTYDNIQMRKVKL